MRSRPFVLVAAVLALALLSAAQSAPPGRLLRAGERLRISVVGLMGEGVETRLLRRVEADGTIRLPMLDADDLDATGMTAGELERDLARRYERQTTAKRATVVVSRLDAGEDHELDTSRGPAGDAIKVTVLNGAALEPAPPAMDQAVSIPIRFEAIPFEDVLGFFRGVLNVPVWANWQALELAGVDRHSQITLELPETTPMERVLALTLDQAGGGFAELRWTWDEGVLTVTTAEDLRRSVEIALFDVRPLLERWRATAPADDEQGPPTYDEMVQRLIDLITTTVASDDWQVNGGGVGKIAEVNRRLIVTATPRMLREIKELLDKLGGV